MLLLLDTKEIIFFYSNSICLSNSITPFGEFNSISLNTSDLVEPVLSYCLPQQLVTNTAINCFNKLFPLFETSHLSQNEKERLLQVNMDMTVEGLFQVGGNFPGKCITGREGGGEIFKDIFTKLKRCHQPFLGNTQRR